MTPEQGGVTRQSGSTIKRENQEVDDLDNPAAPAGGAQANITGVLFDRWMKSCGATTDGSNPYQIVAMLSVGKTVQIGNAEMKPNWHLTMMGDRESKVSENFHFKIEIGKACSHYWHYVLYRVAATKTWHWVGDRNALVTSEVTNQGGGGAGSSASALKSNLSLVTMQARIHSMDTLMSRKVQNKLTAKLTKWDKAGVITDDGRGLWGGGTTV